MSLPEEKVIVEVLKKGRWAQEPWLPQLEVEKGDKVSISINIAYKLQKKGKCTILDDEKTDKPQRGRPKKVAKQVVRKSENNPATADKKAAEG